MLTTPDKLPCSDGTASCPRCGFSVSCRSVVLHLCAPKPGLGDYVEGVLSAVGITKQRVERFIGRPCGCEQRKQVLNAFGRAAAEALFGKQENPH